MVQFFRCSWASLLTFSHPYNTPDRNLCSAFGGLIAFGIQQAHVGIASWRLLFIIEGIPTVLMGLLVILVLPDRPEETSFLNETERTLQLERMNRGSMADRGRTLNTKHILSAFRDWRVSFIALGPRNCTHPMAGLCRKRNLLWLQLRVGLSCSISSHYLRDLWFL